MKNVSIRNTSPVWCLIYLQVAWIGAFSNLADAQTSSRSNSRQQPLIVESEGAGQVCERVRSQAQGVVTQMLVKVGDEVRKGQVLGSLEFDQAKLQYDLSKATYESKAALESAKAQSEAWSAQREEIEASFKKRKVEKSKLDWALGMEAMYLQVYQVQKDLKKTQEIQYLYNKEQYEKRFFKAPCDGRVTEVMVDLGKPVTPAMHLFTIKNDDVYQVPVYLSDESSAQIVEGDLLPVRPVGTQQVTKAEVDRVEICNNATGKRMISLFVPVRDLPVKMQQTPKGLKFEVAMPR